MRKVKIKPASQLRLYAGDHFQSELKRLHRRIMRINALKSGSADVHEVHVKKTRVKGAHERSPHPHHHQAAQVAG